MNTHTQRPLKVFLVMAIAAGLLVGVAELLFLLPGVTLPWGGSVKACTLSEGSVRGWPFLATVPGCGSEGTNALAFSIDILVDLLIASLVVRVFIRTTGVMKRGRHE